MADTRTKLLTRVVSAIVGALLVIGLGYYYGRAGFYVSCTIAIVLGIREYSRVAFRHWQMPDTVTRLYWLTSIIFYALMMYQESLGLLWFALSNVLFFVGALWLTREKVSNDRLLPALAVGTFGMLYCVLFPCFAVLTVMLESGPTWFLFLLALVFAGDTFAYFGGRFLGKSKLMPAISPNKTWEGMAAGLAGSAAIGSLFLHFAFPQLNGLIAVGFCLVCGFAAQSGDLLISLVKRVAQVKDTGHIMPGHGGVLDRLDGIFIAAPLVYGLALYAGSL